MFFKVLHNLASAWLPPHLTLPPSHHTGFPSGHTRLAPVTGPLHILHMAASSLHWVCTGILTSLIGLSQSPNLKGHSIALFPVTTPLNSLPGTYQSQLSSLFIYYLFAMLTPLTRTQAPREQNFVSSSSPNSASPILGFSVNTVKFKKKNSFLWGWQPTMSWIRFLRQNNQVNWRITVVQATWEYPALSLSCYLHDKLHVLPHWNSGSWWRVWWIDPYARLIQITESHYSVV